MFTDYPIDFLQVRTDLWDEDTLRRMNTQVGFSFIHFKWGNGQSILEPTVKTQRNNVQETQQPVESKGLYEELEGEVCMVMGRLVPKG